MTRTHAFTWQTIGLGLLTAFIVTWGIMDSNTEDADEAPHPLVALSSHIAVH